ncbi:hypothetical protein CHELA1G11_10392 [Hyphomicrobiales bacterium]|nr:hypothetical protein CHELA1G11_10392 [Hyphomicrobiales bacterium]CAH1675001.1 hypothetical protein CHELA1G2_13913 [Hyphomicrobiales bacterium]
MNVAIRPADCCRSATIALYGALKWHLNTTLTVNSAKIINGFGFPSLRNLDINQTNLMVVPYCRCISRVSRNRVGEVSSAVIRMFHL